MDDEVTSQGSYWQDNWHKTHQVNFNSFHIITSKELALKMYGQLSQKLLETVAGYEAVYL